MMQCPSCASRIPEGSRFCFACGAAIPSDASVAETVAIADTPLHARKIEYPALVPDRFFRPHIIGRTFSSG